MMQRKTLKVLAVVATIGAVASILWLIQDVRERHKAAEREDRYQNILAKYAGELKPGMTREQVERYLRLGGAEFRQLCCVSKFRGQYVNLNRGWDDLVKIGEEKAPWMCRENNVYVAFEFNPKAKGELGDTNGSDILKRISVFHQLEGCP